MEGKKMKWFIIFSSFAGIVVSLKASCDDARDTQPLTCQCHTTNNVAWYKGKTRFSLCNVTHCYPASLSDHDFSASPNQKTIKIPAFDDTWCGNYFCKDLVSKKTVSFPDCVDSCKCEGKINGGEIAFTVIVYLFDIAYIGVVVQLTCKRCSVVVQLTCKRCSVVVQRTCKRCAGVWKSKVMTKHCILGILTLAVFLLDLGYTITLFVNDNQQDCETACHDKCCTYTLRVVLTVLAWFVSGVGCFMFLYRVIKNKCQGVNE